jgi:hypothetical protein
VLSLSAESTAWDYSPYLALIMDQRSMKRVRQRLQSVYNLSYPKVTVFSGSTTTVRDESQRPFVVGVSYIKGELGTVAQPKIATLAEGTTLDVRPPLPIGRLEGRRSQQCEITGPRRDGTEPAPVAENDYGVLPRGAWRDAVDCTHD